MRDKGTENPERGMENTEHKTQNACLVPIVPDVPDDPDIYITYSIAVTRQAQRGLWDDTIPPPTLRFVSMPQSFI